MSFTMSQVKRKPSSKQQDIKSCYRLIYSDTILTDNVKQGLWQYCNYRFSKRNRGKFDAVILQKMVEEQQHIRDEKIQAGLNINAKLNEVEDMDEDD